MKKWRIGTLLTSFVFSTGEVCVTSRDSIPSKEVTSLSSFIRTPVTNTKFSSSDNIAGTDQVDLILFQWARERTDLDTLPMEVIGRLLRTSRHIDSALHAVFKPFGLDFGPVRRSCVAASARPPLINCHQVNSINGACSRRAQ